jgi:hypothetical protein
MNRTGTLERPIGVGAWAGLSLVGFAFGFLLVFIVGIGILDAVTGNAEQLLDDVPWTFWLTLTAAFSIGGAGLAAAQWLLLRHYTTGAARWILGMAIGNAVLAIIYLVLYDSTPILLNEVVHNVAAGIVIGLIQLPVVLQLSPSARRWPAVTSLAMLAAALVSAAIVFAVGDDFLGGPLGMMTYGIITGAVLYRWIRKADTSE